MIVMTGRDGRMIRNELEYRMTWNTADLCDEHPDRARVLPPLFHDYGGRKRFAGTVVTLKCFEDNALLKATFATPGRGKVLVVDGGGSLRCALVGDVLTRIAHEAGWEGTVIYGAVRDTLGIATFDIGVRALGANPRRPAQRGEGVRDVPVSVGGVMCYPGEHLFADSDGVVVLDAAAVTEGKYS
jgi:regulator of ribonuclease activity A